MILTCPNCTTRFLLPAQSLTPNGRKVRCSNCQELWFQLPDPDEISAAVQKPFDEIPKAVRPLPQGSSLPVVTDDETGKSRKKTGKALAGVISVFALSLLLTYSLSHQIMVQLPASAPYFEMVGIEPILPGQGLVFDRLSAQADKNSQGHETVTVKGQIINLTDSHVVVPMIEAELRDKNEKSLDLWLVEPAQDHVAPESNLEFKFDYQNKNPTADQINIKFVLKGSVKTDGAGAQNIQVPHAGDPAHPSVDGAGAKSPPHASAAPHPESSHGSPASEGHPPPPDHKAAPTDHNAHLPAADHH